MSQIAQRFPLPFSTCGRKPANPPDPRTCAAVARHRCVAKSLTDYTTATPSARPPATLRSRNRHQITAMGGWLHHLPGPSSRPPRISPSTCCVSFFDRVRLHRIELCLRWVTTLAPRVAWKNSALAKQHHVKATPAAMRPPHARPARPVASCCKGFGS